MDKLEEYLNTVLRQPVTVVRLTPLGRPAGQTGKGFGYGTPVQVDYETSSGARKIAVLHTISPGPFGHEHMPDRARILLWSHGAFNLLPRHVRSLDVGAFDGEGGLLSLGNTEEFCLLTEYAAGEAYASDLEQLRDYGRETLMDVARADALCDYLAEIHHVRGHDPDLYIRRNRELVGDGECIMGLADSYPAHPLFTPAVLERIEHLVIEWRWRLREMTYRLRQVHGDFHPWNILFGAGTDFRLLDRSRGEFGDPADDVTCLTMNYIFFSLQRTGRLEGIFENLFVRFWGRYLQQTGDEEMLRVAAPYFAFRCLVMASPVWYPALSESVRQKLLAFLLAVLEAEAFDPRQVNRYCEP